MLPPVQEHFYKKKHSSYKILPAYKKGCENKAKETQMELIYPRKHSKIYLPIDIDGSQGKTIFKVAHRKPETTIFWHLDEGFAGETKLYHEIEVFVKPGKHKLTLVDSKGEIVEADFEVIEKR